MHRSIVRNMRGIILTIDAMLALIALGILISAAVFFVNNAYNAQWTESELNKISMDTLTILEKDGTLESAVSDNSMTSTSTFLNALPGQVCANISFYDSSGTYVNSTQTTGCTNSTRLSKARRSFIVGSIVYYAEMGAWYK